MLDSLLEARKLPALLVMKDGTPVTSPEQWPARRAELLDTLQWACYGYTPKALPASAAVVREDPLYCAGKVLHRELCVTLETPGKPYSFPVHLFLPKSVPHAPVFVHINFRSDIPDRYCPVEEITDNGFALAYFDYQTVTSDDPDFTNGLAGEFIGARPREPHEWGKIGMWAYACSRVLDILLPMKEIDGSRAFVTGHSRLGKTALWCAAQDERFAMGVSNDSGCGGAAIERGKVGEHVREITDVIGYWFCPHYASYADDVYRMPFDHHFVIACVAPRAAYVASAALDTWADPVSEFLSCAAATPAYALLGEKGLVCNLSEPPEAPAVFHGGKIAYHVRNGEHYFSRDDWHYQMAYAHTL